MNELLLSEEAPGTQVSTEFILTYYILLVSQRKENNIDQIVSKTKLALSSADTLAYYSYCFLFNATLIIYLLFL